MLIGLYGPSRAGKDTVAGVLVGSYGFEQRNMAGPIRDVLRKINAPVELDEDSGYLLLDEVVETMGWDDVKKFFPQTVEWMIALGQAMRDIDESIWLNACVGVPYTDLVIADVRQPNEYAYIQNHGGEVWHVISNREAVQVRGMDGLLDNYYFDQTIDNSGTIEQLEELLLSIMEKR